MQNMSVQSGVRMKMKSLNSFFTNTQMNEWRLANLLLTELRKQEAKRE